MQLRVPALSQGAQKGNFFPMGAWDGRERKSLSVRKQVSSLCGCEEKLSRVSVLL